MGNPTGGRYNGTRSVPTTLLADGTRSVPTTLLADGTRSVPATLMARHTEYAGYMEGTGHRRTRFNAAMRLRRAG
jgi:hypothetical protein